MILCDTNILIEFYNGNPAILAALQNIGLPDIAVSVITAGELYYGARDKSELQKMRQNLALIRQVRLDADISDRFLLSYSKHTH